MNINEQWKPIVGYEGLYEISSLGRVKSLKYGKERIMKPKKTKGGYLFVSLYKNGKEKKGCQHIQTNGCLQVNEPPKDKCYYKADNSWYLVAPFMRILISKLRIQH